MATESKKKYNRSSDILTHVGVIAIIILLNYVLSFTFKRFDLTEDKRHSLSDNTIALLQDENRIKDRIFFKVYLEGDLPADLMKIRNAVKEKLDEFRVYAGDNIQYEFIDPNGSDDDDFNREMQQILYTEGIQFCDIKVQKSGQAEVKTVWPGALIEYKGTTVDMIQFFNIKTVQSEELLRNIAEQTINNLEYKLISAVRRVTTDNKKTISFLHGHGELRPPQTNDVRKGLDRYYFVEDVEINGQISALDNTDALIVAKPTQRFSEKDKFVIDQFVMRGGRVLWFLDPLDVPRDSLVRTGQTFGISSNLNIEKDMLFKYGVRINNDIILDESCAPIYIPGYELEFADWYFYPLMRGEEAGIHPITKNIDPIKAEYASSIDLVNESNKDVTKTVLLKSSANSMIFKSPARISYSIILRPPNFVDPQKGEYPVAVLLEGKFSSAFENRPISEAFLNSPDYTTLFKSDSTKMLVVADGDILRNEILDSMPYQGEWNYQYWPINRDIYGIPNANGTPKYIYGNKEFVLNAIDYMVDDNSLIDIRTKTITYRGLNLIKVNEEREFWKFINIAVPLIALLVMAIVQLLLRKRRYAGSVY